MKKIVFSLILMSMVLVGCTQNLDQSDDKPTVVVSFYVLEAITELLAKDQVNIINILPYNADPHTYELDSNDMINLTNEENLIIVGNGFETWYEEAYQDVKPDNANVLDVSKNIDLLNNSLGEIDPHIWTSLSNFKQISIDIAEYLKTIVEDESLIDENLQLILDRLEKIQAYTDALFESKTKSLFITQRPAFVYLADEYEVKMVSVAEAGHAHEVDAHHLEEVIEVIKDNDIQIIFYENPLETDVAETLALETGVNIQLLSSLESIDENSDQDIIDLLEENIIHLAEALQ